MTFENRLKRQLEGMRVLVTGAHGFVGRHVCDRLESLGAKGIGLSRNPPPPGMPSPGDEHIRLDLVTGNIAACLASVKPDAVIHCAGIIGEPVDPEGRRALFAANIEATARLIEAAAAMEPAPKLILVSSAAIYAPMAPGQSAIAEDHPWRPAGLYGVSKAAAAMLGTLAAWREGLPVILAIPFNIIGPGQPEGLVPRAFIRRLRENPEEIITGDLSAVRDWIDVRDVASALLCLLGRDVPAGAYNIASGRGVAVRALLAEICALMGVAPEIRTDISSGNPHAVPVSIGDIRKIEKYCDWYPRFSMKGSLSDMLRE